MVKYTKYKGTSGRIGINDEVAKALGWEHQDELKSEFETIKGKKGLFIFKEEKSKIYSRLY